MRQFRLTAETYISRMYAYLSQTGYYIESKVRASSSSLIRHGGEPFILGRLPWIYGQ